YRDHEYSEYGPDDPPSERHHTEYKYSQAYEHLTERRMCPFVHGKMMNELICRSRMIDLIKICSRHERFAFCHHPLLVKEILYSVVTGVYRFYLLSILV